MKTINTNKLIQVVALLLLLCSLVFSGCANMNPVDPQGQPTPTSPPTQTTSDVKITYNYGDTGPVVLSNNNLVMKTGQKLILVPASGLTKNTRFTSGNENFFGDIMQQEGDETNGQLVFAAKKAGKGKLLVIPNGTETDRATELWVTVQ